MKKIKINIDEIIVGEVLSLEEYEIDYKKSRSNYNFVKNFIGGRFLKYNNAKDAVIANFIGKNYFEKHNDNALLIFYQTNDDNTASICFIDTSALGHSSSILKLEGLDVGRYSSDAKKIEETLLLFKSTPKRAIRYCACGENREVPDLITELGEPMDEKFLRTFFPAPTFCAATKSKNTLKFGAIILVPLFFAVTVGQSFLSGAEERLTSESARLAKERSLIQNEVSQLQKDPMLVNKKKYNNINFKRIAT